MGFIFNIVNGFVKSISDFGILLLSFLPDSPLKFTDDMLNAELLGYINYFIPINRFVQIGTAWLGCIAIWYTVQVGLRWVKVVE